MSLHEMHTPRPHPKTTQAKPALSQEAQRTVAYFPRESTDLQQFLNLKVHQNRLVGSLKHTLLGPTPRISIGLEGGPEFAFPKAMLMWLTWKMFLENLCFTHQLHQQTKAGPGAGTVQGQQLTMYLATLSISHEAMPSQHGLLRAQSHLLSFREGL